MKISLVLAVTPVADVLLDLFVVLLAAKAGDELFKRIGQPAIVGEILAGAVVGPSVLGLVEPGEVLEVFAELGVVFLLFWVGLETRISEMRAVGAIAARVGVAGVVLPFVAGYATGEVLGEPTETKMFLGAALVATSVGITSAVLIELGALGTRAARTMLGAAVIDDVIGLIILAVVSAIVTTGHVSAGSVTVITAKALLFLGGALVVGQYAAPAVSRGFSRINTGVGMKFTLALVFCFVLAYLAHLIGLAPIVGAFAAGLVLDDVTFKDYDELEIIPQVRDAMRGAPTELTGKVETVLQHHACHHLQSLIVPVGNLVVPVFFVYTGMQVDLRTLADLNTVWIALAVTALAFVGKLVSGLVAGPVDRWVVGWGMAPRGEVGLIFAVVGKGLGVIDDHAFSVIVVMVMLTTLLTPVILAHLLKRSRARANAQPASP